jgi:hypothetical protein
VAVVGLVGAVVCGGSRDARTRPVEGVADEFGGGLFDVGVARRVGTGGVVIIWRGTVWRGTVGVVAVFAVAGTVGVVCACTFTGVSIVPSITSATAAKKHHNRRR